MGEHPWHAKWRRQWWYPLGRDPYAPEFVPQWFKEAAQIRMPADDALPPCPIKHWEPDPRFRVQSRAQIDRVRDAAERHGPGNGLTDMMERAAAAKRPPVPYPAMIPGAGELCGFRSRDGVIVTGPCGLRHAMTASEARALAAWLMKMGAEEPT